MMLVLVWFSFACSCCWEMNPDKVCASVYRQSELGGVFATSGAAKRPRRLKRERGSAPKVANKRAKTLKGNIKIGVANITASSNLDALGPVQADILVLQEVRGSREDLVREARKMGYVVAAGKNSDESLVAVLSKAGMIVQERRVQEEVWSDRLCTCRFFLGGKAYGTVHSIYGVVGAKVSEKQELSQLLLKLMEESAAEGGGPVWIAGDFNLEAEEIEASDTMLRQGWRDWHEAATCRGSRAQKARRKDMVWMSPQARSRTGAAEVIWQEGVPTHAIQIAEVKAGKPADYWCYQRGDNGPKEGEVGFTEEEFQTAWRRVNARWELARATSRVDDMWKCLEEVLVKCHQIRDGEFQKPQGRAVQKKEEPPKNYQHEAWTQLARSFSRVKRQIQQLSILWGKRDAQHICCDLRDGIAKCGIQKWEERIQKEWTQEELNEWVQEARRDEDEAAIVTRAKRRAGFHKWCKAESEHHLRALFRWIKQGPRSLVCTDLVIKEDGSADGGKAALVKATEEVWWKLWGRTEGTFLDEVQGFHCGRQMELRPIRGGALKKAVKGISSNKAPGFDGWTIKRMKQWPEGCWKKLSELYHAVEKTGRWPQELRKGIICLLPKGDAEVSIARPGEARPVVLLPMIYRLWAHMRQTDLTRWMHDNGFEGLPDAEKAAETYGLLAAAELEAAEAFGEEAAVIAYDLSKAYDRVDLRVLQKCLQEMGVAEELWRPMMSMTTGQRCIKVMDAVGQWREPKAGIIPGCPCATMCMALILHRWRSSLQKQVPQAMIRCWVDDSTVTAKGATCILASWAVAARCMEDLEAGDGLEVNRKKSGVVTNSKRIEQLIGEAAELKMQHPRGLVVLQHGTTEQRERIITRLRVSRSDVVEVTNDDDLQVKLASAAAADAWFAGTAIDDQVMEVLRGASITVLCEQDGADKWREAEEVLAQKARRMTRSKMRVAPKARDAIKDLGIAQGLGKASKDMAASRTKEALQRAEYVSRLSISLFDRCKLMAASVWPAGLYGTAAHVADAGWYESLRRWTKHAVYRGSGFAKERLLLHLGISNWRVDPEAVGISKALEANEAIVAEKGEDWHASVWCSKSRDGPVACLRQAMENLGARVSREGWRSGDQVLMQPWKSTRKERLDFCLEALRKKDLQKVAKNSKMFRHVEQVDHELVRKVLNKLPTRGEKEACMAVVIGDFVTKSQTKHWQNHDGKCECGEAEETPEHVFWECPKYTDLREGKNGVSRQHRDSLHDLTRKTGLPVLDQEVLRWRRQWAASSKGSGAIKSKTIFVDGSATYPKEPSIRVAGWAVWSPDDGGWRAGCLKPGSSVAAAEATAILEALKECDNEATIITDCKGVWKMWNSLRTMKESKVAKSTSKLAPIWYGLWREQAKKPRVRLEWMPSHRSAEEALQLNIPEWWRKGNDRADEIAKEITKEHDMQEEEAKRALHKIEAGKVALEHCMKIQLRRLKHRSRTIEGTAAKTRKRQAPALPRRAAGKKEAKRPRKAQLNEEVRPIQTDEFLQYKSKHSLDEGTIRRAAEDKRESPGRVHCFVIAGPWCAPGTMKAVNGRLHGQWTCTKCGVRASHSARVSELLRRSCGSKAVIKGDWRAHDVTHDEGAHRCKRCKLVIDGNHYSVGVNQRCPVWAALGEGDVEDVAAQENIRRELSNLSAYRWLMEHGGKNAEEFVARNEETAQQCSELPCVPERGPPQPV